MDNKLKKILVIALSGIGDALMFTPALEVLKKNKPETRIDALVMFDGAANIYERTGHFENVIKHDFINSSSFESLRFVTKLRGQYDAVINVYPSNRREYNIINFLIGAKFRVGIRYSHNDLANLGFLNNISIKEDESLHNVEENVRLVDKLIGITTEKIPNLNFPLLEDDFDFKNKFLSENKISDNDIIIGFHAGCNTLKNHINRRWAPQNFSALASRLIEEKNAKVLVFGGPEESDLKKNIVDLTGHENIISVKAKSLSMSAAIMERCNVFVTNDSSLMHVASALSLNIVALIGPTNLNLIHPWNTDYKIARLELKCSPCFYYSPRPLICIRNDKKWKCIKDLTIEEVFQHTISFLGE